ncbi:MAG: HD domain-containing protein [Candidatus Aminicenantaceae bacterium]
MESWFENYVLRFKSPDQKYTQNIEIKKDHTYRVCEEIISLGKSLHLNKQDLDLAKTIALLHDVGRFEQYECYRTFSDFKSENHAQLSIKVLNQENVLEGIEKNTAEIIHCSILNHNKASLVQNETGRCLFFSKLLRDADKLDVLYVVTDYYHNGKMHSNESLELELPDDSYISDEVYNDLVSGKIVNHSNIRNLNDLKLLQMAWIYDVNFPHTFQLIQKREYLEKIRDALLQSDEAQNAYTTTKSYLDKKITS